jgi:hypothetical protein
MLGWSKVEFLRERKFREQSKRLGEFLRADFSSIAAELARVFPHTDGLQERYVPLVQRYAHELSGLYAQPPLRYFGTNAAPEDGSAFVKLREVYFDAGVDAFLADVHRALLVQQTMVLLVWPDDEVGRVRLQAFEPWQVDWTSRDANRRGDLRACERLELQIPIDVTETSVVYGKIVLTATQAWVEGPQGRRAFYPQRAGEVVEFANPLGRIPVVVLRGESPLPGRWAAPVNEALLVMQYALCVSESDTELLVHTQAWGQRVIEGAQSGQQVEELQVGPDKVLALVSHDPEAPPPRLVIVQGQPPLAQITGWNESRLRLLCSMFDLNPDAFLKSNTATSASARAFDARDREESRQRFRPKFERAETELARLVAATLNLRDPVQVPTDLVVTMTWDTFDPPVDALHESQALAADVALGVRSVVDVVAQRERVPRGKAVEILRRNRADNAEFGVDVAAATAATATTPSSPAGAMS